MVAQGSETTAVIGPISPAERDILRRAAERANTKAHFFESVFDSQEELSELRPKCIFADGDDSGFAETTAWIRDHSILFPTQVIAMVSDLRDSSFVRAYRNGADDVIIRSNVDGVTRRIANLQQFDPWARPTIERGRVVISHQSDGHRRRLGRVLRQAGFDVHFAVDADEVIAEMASEVAPQLVVVSDELLPVSKIAQARRSAVAPRTPFVVVAATVTNRIMLDSIVGGVATISESAPHDHLLFLANDLLRCGHRQIRNSPRYLFDTICSFRSDDAFSPQHGLTYNVSETGIYVRTLDPPPKNTALWLQLRPPHTTVTVRLRGTLAWVAMAGRGARATPPGFGLQIQAASSPARDLEVYRRAYCTLAEVPNQLALSWAP